MRNLAHITDQTIMCAVLIQRVVEDRQYILSCMYFVSGCCLDLEQPLMRVVLSFYQLLHRRE